MCNEKEKLAFENYFLRTKLGITSHLTDEEFQLVKKGAKAEQNSSVYGDRDKIDEDVSKINVKENILQEFWYRRQHEARRWNWVQLLSNMLF